MIRHQQEVTIHCISVTASVDLRRYNSRHLTYKICWSCNTVHSDYYNKYVDLLQSTVHSDYYKKSIDLFCRIINSDWTKICQSLCVKQQILIITNSDAMLPCLLRDYFHYTPTTTHDTPAQDVLLLLFAQQYHNNKPTTRTMTQHHKTWNLHSMLM